MQILLRFNCAECRKSFIVEDEELEDQQLGCPFCGIDIEVPDDDQDD